MGTFFSSPAADDGGEITPPPVADDGGEITPPPVADDGGEITPPPAADGAYYPEIVNVHSKVHWDRLFEDLRNDELMVVNFSASWCGPCRFFEPVFKEMTSRFTDVVFVKIDVDELGEVAKTFRVEAMPTFVLVKGGQEVSRVVGVNKDELERKIPSHRANSS